RSAIPSRAPRSRRSAAGRRGDRPGCRTGEAAQGSLVGRGGRAPSGPFPPSNRALVLLLPGVRKRARRLKVLLTDSRHLLREALALLLRQEDEAIEVTEASSLAAAIAAIEREEFDIVLVERRLAGPGDLSRLIAQARGMRVVLLCSEASPQALPEAL